MPRIPPFHKLSYITLVSIKVQYRVSTISLDEPWSRVMGGDSCSKGHGFESQGRMMDGYFSHLFVVNVCLERQK